MTPVPAVPAVAHGGGAPEAAMIGLPLLLFVTFLLLDRRARRREQEAGAAPPADPAFRENEHDRGTERDEPR